MNKLNCPVCKRSEVQIYHVYLGHGRATKYFCLPCEIVFAFGDTKFGKVGAVEKDGFITNDYKVTKMKLVEDKKISPDQHKDFEADRFCRKCGGNVTWPTLGEGTIVTNKDGTSHQEKCPTV